MVSQYIWVGIVAGVFVAGIGIGFAVLQQTTPGSMNFDNMSPQQMRDAMQDPDFRQNMMNEFGNNPQSMQDWMSPMMGDPKLQSHMRVNMMQHSQFMQGIMNDPQMMEQMQQRMNSGNMMIGQGTMMGNMTQHQSMHEMMMSGISDPIMKQQVIDEMNRHHSLMKDLLEHAIDEPGLKKQLLDKIEKHIQSSNP